MNNLKRVSRDQYIAAVKVAGLSGNEGDTPVFKIEPPNEVRSHFTEGYRLRVAQWVEVESACGRFRVTYSTRVTEGRPFPSIVNYYIEDV